MRESDAGAARGRYGVPEATVGAWLQSNGGMRELAGAEETGCDGIQTRDVTSAAELLRTVTARHAAV